MMAYRCVMAIWGNGYSANTICAFICGNRVLSETLLSRSLTSMQEIILLYQGSLSNTLQQPPIFQINTKHNAPCTLPNTNHNVPRRVKVMFEQQTAFVVGPEVEGDTQTIAYDGRQLQIRVEVRK